ncbi:Arsenical pump-driving ATPase, partial [Salmonella enterica subsp. enterica serovar Montevideo str. S5-403]
SCRSVLAEATPMSAGSHPAGYVHPRALALLAREGISTEGYFSKSWNDLPQTPDIVVTVCSNAAGETCPAWLGNVMRTHWGVDDPAHATGSVDDPAHATGTGSDAEIDAAFVTAYQTLRARIEAFLALPLNELLHDRARLKVELDRIGEIF